jgi:hypothetical protein
MGENCLKFMGIADLRLMGNDSVVSLGYEPEFGNYRRIVQHAT